MVRQDIEPLDLITSDDHARAGLLELLDPLALFVPDRLFGNDVDHRRRDGLRDELEHPVNMRELLVLFGELIINLAVVPADLGGSCPGGLAARGDSRPPRCCRPGRKPPGLPGPPRSPRTRPAARDVTTRMTDEERIMNRLHAKGERRSNDFGHQARSRERSSCPNPIYSPCADTVKKRPARPSPSTHPACSTRSQPVNHAGPPPRVVPLPIGFDWLRSALAIWVA